MRCPVDNELLVMADRNGVEIDYCPKCRGVWLDRGELDKIIERSEAPVQAARPSPPPPPQAAPQQPHYAPPPRRYDHDDDDYRYKKKRKSILGEIFDF